MSKYREYLHLQKSYEVNKLGKVIPNQKKWASFVPSHIKGRRNAMKEVD